MDWNRDTYAGEFKDGMLNGKGTHTIFFSGAVYEGEFKDGKKHGQGTYTFANGDKYEGEYKEGKQDGLGIYTFMNGEKYIGQNKNNKANGKGITYAANGAVKESGIYKDNILVISQYIDPDEFSHLKNKNIESSVNYDLQKNNQLGSQIINTAKSKCEELGFKLDTEGFGKCVLQLTK